MRIAIVGGALQGMEAVLLSNAAGYETVVLDRKKDFFWSSTSVWSPQKMRL